MSINGDKFARDYDHYSDFHGSKYHKSYKDFYNDPDVQNGNVNIGNVDIRDRDFYNRNNKNYNDINGNISISDDQYSFIPYQSLSYTPLYVLYQAPIYKPYQSSTYTPYQIPYLGFKQAPVHSFYRNNDNNNMDEPSPYQTSMPTFTPINTTIVTNAPTTIPNNPTPSYYMTNTPNPTTIITSPITTIFTPSPTPTSTPTSTKINNVNIFTSTPTPNKISNTPSTTTKK
jgi:hypothetical protein